MAPLTPALVFIGFMGSGKSRSAREADAAGLPATDADELVERQLGMPIAEFFERQGEAAFREREEAVTAELLERADGGAIALGGGAVLSLRVREALGRHLVAWLDVPADVAWERAGRKPGRPLAGDREAFDRLYRDRASIYAELADVRMLWAESESGRYPVFVGSGILGREPWPVPGRGFLVTDRDVAARFADRLPGQSARVVLEPGERSKTLAEAERVLRELARSGMTRNDHLVALGGGVIGDMAGFCAAIYQRGVPVVQVPTTLVAQADSAYGGKTGVDIPEAKNYLGAYHLPAEVIADTAALSSLPRRELAAGFVEVVKTALLAGGDLWTRVRAIESLDAGQLDEVVFACARYKVGVVAADERDSGPRQALNLGHTVGHAIEAAGGYERHRHGEAVGLGLLAALRLSDADGLRSEVRELLTRHGLPTRLEGVIDTERVLEAVARDKKRGPDGVTFVLLESPGEPMISQRIPADRVRAAVEELR